MASSITEPAVERARGEAPADDPLIDLSQGREGLPHGSPRVPRAARIDLQVDPGEMVSVVGPSGSGKSTALNVITGIDRPTATAPSSTGNASS